VKAGLKVTAKFRTANVENAPTTIHAWEHRETSVSPGLFADDNETIDQFFADLVNVAGFQALPMQEYTEAQQEVFNCFPAAAVFP